MNELELKELEMKEIIEKELNEKELELLYYYNNISAFRQTDLIGYAKNLLELQKKVY